MNKEQALIILKELHKDAFYSVRTALETLIPEIKEESEDEKIRKEIICFLSELNELGKNTNFDRWNKANCAKWITWLEKQGKRDKFKDAIQIGDKVTRNRDGVLVNLSQLERVAKKENLCEQKFVDNVEPKFHKGQWIACRGLNTAFIVNIHNDRYEVEFIDGSKGFPHIDYVDGFFHLWNIEDAKDGDIIYIKRYRTNDEWLLIFKNIKIQNRFIDVYDYYAFCITSDNIYHESIGSGCWGLLGKDIDIVCPATKEQRDLLFSKIHSTGYEWNEKEKVIVPLSKLKSKETDGEPN